MRARSIPGAVPLAFGAWLVAGAAPAQDALEAHEAGPRLDRERVSAQGRQSAVLSVPAFGRYSVQVTSPQGTGLQLTDRMAGPGEVSGLAGERDGRLDVFLDRGDYRVTTLGHRAASGDAALTAHAFAPADAAPPPHLEPLRLVSSSLRDLEQRSWWLDLSSASRVDLEAAGRSLADLRLWRDGRWLVDAVPETRLLQPRVGQPLLACRLSASLEPGLYLLTAYGGPEQAWAEQSDQHPLHLRWGIPSLGSTGRRRLELSPFGIDRFLVPGSATVFRVELPEARPLELRVAPFDPEAPFAEPGARAAVEKDSVPPVAELEQAPGDSPHLVTLGGEAGQPYLLQHYQRLDRYRFRGNRPHWVSTIHSGHAADSVDATGILVETPRGSPPQHVEPLRSQVIELAPGALWRRRANLLGETTLFVRLEETSRYTVRVEDAEAKVRLEPFLISKPRGYQAPEFRDSGAAWDLDAGFWVLTLAPTRKGVAVVELRPASLLDRLLDSAGLGAAAAEQPVAGAVRFEEVPLRRNSSYQLYVGEQPGVGVGAVVRPLPLDLSDPLPVWQRPGEALEVPFSQTEPGRLAALTEDGESLELSLDGGGWQREPPVAPGAHRVRVRVEGERTRAYALGFVPHRLDPRAALPELDPERLAALPDFPKLAPGAPVALDLAHEQVASYLLEAPEPGLYQLESTGLLATEGNLRTRTTTSLVRRAENGVGRNFAIRSFLTPGDYQLSVTAQGRSAGHLGLRLERTPLRRGGYLTLYRPARVSLATGEAIEYRFVITEPGEFRVRALGSQGRRLRCRLDDREGWPLVTPEGDADLARWFDPGHYRFVVLPEATDARVVTVIEPVERPRRYSGHGPHRLPLGRRVENVWLEPEAGAPRDPDVWELELPADAELRLEVGGEMRGQLLREDGSPAAEVPVRRGFQGRLARGRYRLELSAARIDNRAPYALGVWPVPLMAGLERELELPAELPVAVGETGLVELSSFGTQDVRATLFDASGQPVAASDDRPDDWNFAIGLGLDAGDYRLRVEPVGSAGGTTRVAMRRPALVEEPPVALPAGVDLVAGEAAHLYPLALAAAADLLIATARSDEGVGLALERRAGESWRATATASGRRARLEVPLPSDASLDGRYRLRLWSLDRRESPVRLELTAVALPEASERALADGVGLTPVEGFGAAAAVRLARPGLLRAAAGVGLRWCSQVDAACRESREGLVPATGERLLVVADAAATARATRVALQPGAEPLLVPLPEHAPLSIDVAASGAAPLLLSASTLAGQPGVEAVAEGCSSDATRMAVAAGASATVALRGATRARLWRAAPGAGEARLTARVFGSPRALSLAAGLADGVLEPGQAARLELGSAASLLRLALDPALVAVLSQGDETLGVHWGGSAALAESVETAAEALTLLHSGDPAAPARFAVELLPLGSATPALAPGAPLERVLDRAGRLRLDIAPLAGGGTLHVRGASGDAVLVDATGRVQRGLDLELAPGAAGVLSAPHEPGLLLAWTTDPGARTAGPWPEVAGGSPVSVTLPASPPLAGGGASFRIHLAAPAVLHLRTAAPVATRIAPAGAEARVEVHAGGARLDAFLPEGVAELTLRALGGSLSGRAELTATPVVALTEGLGPELLLAPGASRFFSFRVEQPGPVGIGVRASEDVVEARLLDARGALLGEGSAQMPTLQPGGYLLELRAPRDGRPVRAQAALVGLDPPDTGPPEEVVRQYLERFAVQTVEEER